jgi:nucleoside-diphosphate-sugar epimerase
MFNLSQSEFQLGQEASWQTLAWSVAKLLLLMKVARIIWNVAVKVKKFRAAVPQPPCKEYLQHLDKYFHQTDPLLGDFVRSTRFLVIGGTGFTGSAIVHELRQRGAAKVRILGRSLPPRTEYPYCPGKAGKYPLDGVEYARGDVTNKESLVEALEGIDVVFHTACSYGNPGFTQLGTGEDAENTNYHGMMKLMDVARAKGVKSVLFTSSVDTVFCGQDLENINEKQPYLSLGITDQHYAEGKLAVGDHYSRTKIMGEKVLLAADNKEGVRTMSIRPNGIYGPGENNAYPKAIMMTWPLTFWPTYFGRKQRCDWISVASLAHAHILGAYALKTKPDVVGGRPFFVSDDDQNMNTSQMGVFMSVMDAMEITICPVICFRGLTIIADIMERSHHWLDTKCGIKIAPFLVRKEAFRAVITQTHDISAIKKDLGYQPIMTVKQAMDWMADEMVRRYKVFE